MAEFTARVALGDRLVPVGLLRFTRSDPRQFSSFTYDPAWLNNPRAFALRPGLPLGPAPYFASGKAETVRDALDGVFSDAAPDSWGRRLLERSYGNALSEFEYLTLADDTCRQGALRFVDDQGGIIRGTAAQAVPRLVDLPEITAIARAYEQGKPLAAQQMQALVGAGASGGARPKANVRDGNTFWLAKFTSVHDQHPIERVEVATLRLARACGINVPDARLELADTPAPIALIQRFDRTSAGRIPYISARTALGKTGLDSGSYTEIVDVMRGASANAQADFQELFLRLVFTILVSNKDDHLKNHGFIYVGRDRWRLSPMFDVNPAPDRTPHLETAIVEGGAHTRSIRLALEACGYFELTETAARQTIRQVARRISDTWRDELRQAGVSGTLARDYEDAFVHEEMDIGLGL